MTLAPARLATAVILPAALLAATGLPAQKPASAPARSTTDASWARAYATICDGQPCSPANTRPAGSDINSDPHFLPLLRGTLTQREGWWVDGHGGTAAVSSTAQTFLGVQRDVVLNRNRYLTATGCVPHDCTTTGMLWIDTAARPATVVFVGENLLASTQGQSGYHLFLYTSDPGTRYTTNFPQDFVENLARWQQASTSPYDDQHIVLVTVVWPNGRSRDLFYSELFPQQPAPRPAVAPGVKP